MYKVLYYPTFQNIKTVLFTIKRRVGGTTQNKSHSLDHRQRTSDDIKKKTREDPPSLWADIDVHELYTDHGDSLT